MKKKILLILICGILSLSLTGCGNSKLSGRYEWRPYDNMKGTYAYYDFKDNGECVFAVAIENTYGEAPQTYFYTVQKIDKTNYEIKLKHIKENDEKTLSYNSKSNTIIDDYFKDIELGLEDKNANSDNRIYGQFKKVSK